MRPVIVHTAAIWLALTYLGGERGDSGRLIVVHFKDIEGTGRLQPIMKRLILRLRSFRSPPLFNYRKGEDQFTPTISCASTAGNSFRPFILTSDDLRAPESPIVVLVRYEPASATDERCEPVIYHPKSAVTGDN